MKIKQQKQIKAFLIDEFGDDGITNGGCLKPNLLSTDLLSARYLSVIGICRVFICLLIFNCIIIAE